MELIGVKVSEEVIIRIYNTNTPWGYADIRLQWYRGTTTRSLRQPHTGQEYRLAGVMFLHARAETIRYPIPPGRDTRVPAALLTASNWYSRQIPLIWRGVVDNLYVVRETFMYFPHKKQVVTNKGPIKRRASLEAIEREEAVCEQLLEGYYESIHQTGGPSALSFIYTLLRGDLAGWMHVIDRKSVEPLQEPNVQRPAAPPARQLQEEAPSAHAPIARIRGGGNPRGKTMEQIQKQSNAPPAIKATKKKTAEPSTGAEDDRKMPAQPRGKSEEALDRMKARLGIAMDPARQLVVPGPVNPPPIHRMTEGTDLVSLMDVMEQQAANVRPQEAVDISEQQAILHSLYERMVVGRPQPPARTTHTGRRRQGRPQPQNPRVRANWIGRGRPNAPIAIDRTYASMADNSNQSVGRGNNGPPRMNEGAAPSQGRRRRSSSRASMPSSPEIELAGSGNIGGRVRQRRRLMETMDDATGGPSTTGTRSSRGS